MKLEKREFGIYSVGVLIGVVVTLLGNQMYANRRSERHHTETRHVAELAPHELASRHYSARMTPATMTLRVVEARGFATEAAEGGVPGATAFTRYRREPCEISVPEGWLIEADPQRGRARFAVRENSDSLAHEILHCLRGAWHPPWPEIITSQATELSNANSFPADDYPRVCAGPSPCTICRIVPARENGDREGSSVRCDTDLRR